MGNRAVLYDPATETWLAFTDPVDRVEVHALDGVLPALQRLEDRCRDDDLYAAGFVSYEAAAACDPALTTHPPGDLPLLHFGLYRQPQPVPLPVPDPVPVHPDWQPGLAPTAFAAAIDSIHAAIADGATYQVNFTFPLRARFTDDPWRFFRQLVHGQRAPGAGYIDAGRWAVCSASPELFFHRADGRLTMRPMKGTAPRGRTLAEDRQAGEELRRSPKNRAENVMILDMVRNDLGRLAPPGAVEVTELYALEKYPTLWQLTSAATARTDASLAETFAALFPCASITGAPKAQTMQIITQLEAVPRGIYTGSFGWIAPDGCARFNVAIRTALIDREQQTASYGVGAGITWDSVSDDEYRECLTKAEVLNRTRPEIALIESLRWTPRRGYFLLEEHLDRLADSADYFDHPFDRTAITEQLAAYAAGFSNSPRRVRLLLHADGALDLSDSELPLTCQNKPLPLALAATPVDSQDVYLFHKTTRRNVYEEALAVRPDFDDVVLWNESRELTETCIGNLVLAFGDRLVTPPVACGLLAGTYRANLLRRGVITEQVVDLDDLPRADAIYRINAVRKWQRISVVEIRP